MSLTVTVEQKAKGAYVFYPSGALNSNTFPIFEEKINLILKESPTLLVFDLDELNYLSSAGIRVILKARDALKKNNGKITFMNLQPQIKKVFDIINALPSMQIFKSIEELDEYLDVMQKKVTQGEGLIDT
jgi:anti-anti-sigma factor